MSLVCGENSFYSLPELDLSSKEENGFWERYSFFREVCGREEVVLSNVSCCYWKYCEGWWFDSIFPHLLPSFLKRINLEMFRVWLWKVTISIFHLVDLPKLESVSTGAFSFYKTNTVVFNSRLVGCVVSWSSATLYIDFRREFVHWIEFILSFKYLLNSNNHLIFPNWMCFQRETVHSRKLQGWSWIVCNWL